MPYRQEQRQQYNIPWTLLISSFFFVWVFFASRFFFAFFVVVVVVFLPSGEKKRTEIWIYWVSILEYRMSFAFGNKKNCLLPIDNHLRNSPEINKEFNQSVAYYSIRPYKWSYFLVFFIYISTKKSEQMNLALETEEFFILSFDDTQKKSNIKCHDIYRFFCQCLF